MIFVMILEGVGEGVTSRLSGSGCYGKTINTGCDVVKREKKTLKTGCILLF